MRTWTRTRKSYSLFFARLFRQRTKNIGPTIGIDSIFHLIGRIENWQRINVRVARNVRLLKNGNTERQFNCRNKRHLVRNKHMNAHAFNLQFLSATDAKFVLWWWYVNKGNESEYSRKLWDALMRYGRSILASVSHSFQTKYCSLGCRCIWLDGLRERFLKYC